MFLNSASNAERASEGVEAPRGVSAANSWIILGSNREHSLPSRFFAIRAGISSNFRHSKRVEVSKNVHAAQQCSGSSQFEHRAPISIGSLIRRLVLHDGQRNADAFGAPSPRPRGPSFLGGGGAFSPRLFEGSRDSSEL